MAENVTTATRTCRLLYFGAAGVGKRENLGIIHRTIPPESRLDLAVEDPERQIAFRFVQPEGDCWQVLVQAVDAGREKPRVAGRSDGKPFDAVVFAVDSGAAHLDQSLATLESLKRFLDSWDQDLMEVPVVIQYNRRAAPDALPVDRLESLLNPWGLLAYPADTARGEGVRETLKSALGLAINYVRSRPAEDPIAETTDRSGSNADADPAAGQSLDLEYGPPVPGLEAETLARRDAILDELRPPVVVPVRLPRRLLQGDGTLRVLLELELTDDDRL